MEITRADAGGRLALELAGAFPADEIPAMRRRLQELAGTARGPVDLDLSRVEAMDGSTMAVLLKLRADLARGGAAVNVVGARDAVARLYELYDAAEQRPSLHEKRDKTSALEDVGLADQAHAEARSLPFGKQRLLEIARALATEPRLLLLDEPAAGLNAREAAELVGHE